MNFERLVTTPFEQWSSRSESAPWLDLGQALTLGTQHSKGIITTHFHTNLVLVLLGPRLIFASYKAKYQPLYLVMFFNTCIHTILYTKGHGIYTSSTLVQTRIVRLIYKIHTSIDEPFWNPTIIVVVIIIIIPLLTIGSNWVEFLFFLWSCY